jgi:hypothetical protein
VIENVEVSQTYTLEISAKSLTFVPRTIVLDDGIHDLEIFATDGK